MDGVDVWGRSPYYDVATNADLKLKVSKTGDSMTGNLTMNGNHIMGLPLDMSQIIDGSEATSYNVVQNKVSQMIIGKVDKIGDTMSGDLLFTSPAGATVARYLGCTGLEVNKQFTILMGNLTNTISYTNPGTINIQSSNGTLFRLDNTDIMRVGTNGVDYRIKIYQQILLGADIDADEYTITNLDVPTNPADAVPKYYVDDMKCTEGVIPPLENNSSKTGFYCIASSEYSSTYAACNAFRMVSGVEWCTLSIRTNFWIKVYCPNPVRIWKFGLAGRNSDLERIYNWRLEGSNDNVNFDIILSKTNTFIGKNLQEFTVDTTYYQWYRLYVLNAEATNPGLRYFQIYKYLV